MSPLLEMRTITKEYRGVAAVKDVSFALENGEIHALVGENGAGKSTLTKIIAGAVALTSGTMLLDGKPITFAVPKDALSAGIAMVYQENSLVPALTVAQNIFLGKERFFNRMRGINIAAQQFLQSLNFGDEPTASLTPEEKFHFFGLMKRLKQNGVSIIFISHALEEALQNADRITVLRDGQHVLTDLAANLDRSAVIRAMVGRNLSGEIYGVHAGSKSVRKRGRKVLSVQNLSMGSMVRNTSFSVFAGQVTGMFGLIGSGRTETAKIIAGVLKRDMLHGGEVKLDGRPVRYRVPQPAVRDGIVYVTEDRKLEGFFETMSIGGNLNVSAMATRGGIFTLVNLADVRRLAKKWIEAIKIRAINGDARVIELSGGNQQKVVIAKSLVQTPKLIIFDEPTRGVDVGAIAEIHQFINQLADEGLAVVVISSYLPEIMNLSDRILVTRQGRVVEEFTAREATEERIMYAAVH